MVESISKTGFWRPSVWEREGVGREKTRRMRRGRDRKHNWEKAGRRVLGMKLTIIILKKGLVRDINLKVPWAFLLMPVIAR